MVARAALLLLVFLLAAPSGVRGQENGASAMVVDSATGGIELQVSAFLDDRGLQSALHSGLPIRIEVRVELWKDGFFDSQEAGGTWRASVVHDAISRSYQVTVAGEEPLSLESMDEVGWALDQAFDGGVTPTREGRYYYLAQVDLETLSLSDLEELGRWLQGDLGPAVSGDRAPETAVARGLRRIMVRALGLPTRRERLRTPTFQWTNGIEGSGPGR